MNPPFSFQLAAQGGNRKKASGYPYQIRASDLDKNFVFATLDVDPSLIDISTGAGGHKKRKLKIPALPSGDSAKNLTATGARLSWEPGMPKPPDGTSPQNLTAVGETISWTPGIPELPATGTHVLGCVDGALAWIETEEC